MEVLNGELPHYEVVNALQELRDENKELREKLEEHSAGIEKLQKGYDTLDIEFKTLQHNYSSLMMTARSEIQKKSQIITQLNAEKKKLVLNALKNGKHAKRNVHQGVKNPARRNYRASGSGHNKNKEDNVNED